MKFHDFPVSALVSSKIPGFPGFPGNFWIWSVLVLARSSWVEGATENATPAQEMCREVKTNCVCLENWRLSAGGDLTENPFLRSAEV